MNIDLVRKALSAEELNTRNGDSYYIGFNAGLMAAMRAIEALPPHKDTRGKHLQQFEEATQISANIGKSAPLAGPALSDEEIDIRVDSILRAAGSGLRHYSMQKSIDDMRTAMRCALLAKETK